jgi:hypothetical protein
LDSVEYIDRGVSGAKDRRPSLDRLVVDARRRRFDVLVVWRLDRLGRNLKHLVTLLEDMQAVGIAFVSLGEGIDCTTAAGRLQLHVLAALAEFERARIAERVRAGSRESVPLASVWDGQQRMWRRRHPADRPLVRARGGSHPRRVAVRRASGQTVPETCRTRLLDFLGNSCGLDGYSACPQIMCFWDGGGSSSRAVGHGDPYVDQGTVRQPATGGGPLFLVRSAKLAGGSGSL